MSFGLIVFYWISEGWIFVLNMKLVKNKIFDFRQMRLIDDIYELCFWRRKMLYVIKCYMEFVFSSRVSIFGSRFFV